MSNHSLEGDVGLHKQTPSPIHISCLAAIGANNSFELPMKPIHEKKPKRTISMLSLKVHVDKGDYQNISLDDTVDLAWNDDEEELLKDIGADKTT